MRADRRKLGQRGGGHPESNPSLMSAAALLAASCGEVRRILPHMRLELVEETLEIVQHIDLELVIHLGRRFDSMIGEASTFSA